jgi:hypothetical protein
LPPDWQNVMQPRFRTNRIIGIRAFRGVVAALLLLASFGVGAEVADRQSSVILPGMVPLAGTSTSIVVSEVYGGGGNSGSTWKNDFVELFNVSASSVNVTGWSVQYASSSGSSWQVTSLSGSIGPGQYYLVREAAGTGGTTDLPAPNATGGISMSATSGKIALVSSTAALSGTCPTSGTIVDLVGYGSANCFEGTGGTPTLSNTTAALRNDNGCADAGNNGTDFSTGAPNPRNSASPLNPCSGGGGPFITTGSPLPTATEGVEYSVTFAAAGGSGTGYTFLLLSGTLPPGLTFTDGTLSGEPSTTIGSPFSFTIQVTDSASATSSKAFQLAVHTPDTCAVDGPAPRGCGVERWSVKTGSDPDAALVDLTSATPTSIASLRTFPYPNSMPSNGRVAPAETTQWVIHGTLTKYKIEDDSDYHLVVQDGAGVTMVTESVFPGDSPACVSTSSPFLPGMAITRCEMDSALPLATGSFQTVSVPVRIVGVGMFDFSHGQTGAAPNQIEIHPIIDIHFPATANLATATGSNVTVTTPDLALTFPSVSVAGTTTAVPQDPSASGTAPSGNSLVGPSFDLATTATTAGLATLCFDLHYVTDAAAFGKLKVLHAESGALVDRTSSRSFAAKMICSSLPSLSDVVVSLASVEGTVTVSDGDGQTVTAGAPFQPLKVLVRDATATPLSGIAVTFSSTGGGSGANGSFASSAPVLTDVNGIATASSLTANSVAGGFTVTASAAGIAPLATFNETNVVIDAPTNVVATASTATSVSVTWSASAGATSYEVVRIGAGGILTSLGTTGSPPFTDSLAAADTAYLYKVRAVAPGTSSYSSVDLATTKSFTDPALTGLAAKPVHFSELRGAINAVRALAGLEPYTFTDSTLSNGMLIKAAHLTDLRAGLAGARATLLLSPIIYTHSSVTPGASVISAADVAELRDGVK